MRTVAGLVVGALASVLMIGCSFGDSIGSTPVSASEDVIEGDIAAQLGFALSATCTEPEGGLAVGGTMPCSAAAPDGRLIEFVSTLESDDEVLVETSNIIPADLLPAVEEIAVAAIESTVGRSLGNENFDCGDEVAILNTTGSMTCILTDPDSGEMYDTSLMFDSLDPINLVDFEVAAEPRG